MKLLNFKNSIWATICFLVFSNFCIAQQGEIIINQDKEIEQLLSLKKEINSSENNSNRYKIQIFSGNRSGAENAMSKFNVSVSKWRTKLVYETPNYKIWAGSFRTRLQADRALIEVKRKFPSAFIFKPKKEKD